MIQAPEDVVPARAVPEPREQERDEDVARPDPLGRPGAAERDVDVIAKPGGERDVPAPPEVRRRARHVRMIEVLGQLEPQPARRAARDVGVRRKIRVDLDGKSEDPGPQHFERRVVQRKHLVRDHADVVGDHELLEETPDHQVEAAGRLRHREAPRLFDLRQQIRRALDRPGHQVREERDEDGDIEQAPARADLAPEHVDRVAHRLERVERDPHRQEDAQHRQADVHAGGGEHDVQVVDEEIEILEEAQHPEVRDDADGHERPLALHPPLHATRGEVVDGRRRRNQDQEPRVDIPVEHIARDEQQHVLPAVPEPPVERDDHDEEDDEVEAVKNHGKRWRRRDANISV